MHMVVRMKRTKGHERIDSIDTHAFEDVNLLLTFIQRGIVRAVNGLAGRKLCLGKPLEVGCTAAIRPLDHNIIKHINDFHDVDMPSI